MSYCLNNYTVHCSDDTSGTIGCFLFDIEFYEKTGKFKAICPVFSSLEEFYMWDNVNGCKRRDMFIERDF